MRSHVEFDVFRLIPGWARRAARRVLPASFVDSSRDKVMSTLYGFGRSSVDREPAFATFLRRRVFHARPVLFHLDVHIADHCNMRCRGCSHFSNIAEPALADVDEFDRDLARLAEIFGTIRDIFLLGGEPLLHPRVDEFVRIAARHFPRTSIYLFTNSTLVTRMDERVWKALSDTGCILYCDRYPVDLPIAEIERLAEEHHVRLKWTEDRDEFFTIPIDLEGSQDAAASFSACSGVDNCVNLRHGRLYPCARIAYIDIFREHFGIEGLEATEDDSISIHGDADPWEIMDFLLAPVPWCRHCDQEHLHSYPWSRGERSIGQWTDVPR